MPASNILDLAAIGRAAPVQGIIDRERKKQELRAEKFKLAPEAAAADLALAMPSAVFDPVGTFFRGTKALGNILAGGIEDVGLGLAYPVTGQAPNLENLRHALTEWTPTPTEEALAQERGVGAALTRGGVGAIKTAPLLTAGGVVTAATKLPPYVVYPTLFGTEAYEHTAPEELEKAGLPPMTPMSRAYEVTKAATIGALYPLVGTWVKPVAGTLINKLGLYNSPNAQKAVETVVDQALMQSVTEVITVAEYAAREQETPKSPEELAELMVESFGNILLFAVPRVLGYARGRPSEYEVELRKAIEEEKPRLRNFFLQQDWKRLQQAINASETPGARPEDLQAAAMRAGLIRAQPDRGLTVEQRQAEERAVTEAERADIERAFTEATRDPMARYRPKLLESIKAPVIGRPVAGTTPGRRLAAQFAQEEAGTPIGITAEKASTTEVPSAVQIEKSAEIHVQPKAASGETVAEEVRQPEAKAADAKAGAMVAKLPQAAVGDIVDLYGHIGELGRDEDGRLVVRTSEGIVEVPAEDAVKLRLAVTPDGKIIRNGTIYEPAVGGGKSWRNAYDQKTGRLKIREVGGNKGVVYLVGPSSDYIVAKLSLQEPAKPPAKPSKAPRLTKEEAEADLYGPATENVDTPVDEYIFGTKLSKEADQRRAAAAKEEADLAALEQQDKAERVAATVTLRNNIAAELPELQLERYRRKGGDPHTGEIKPARIIYNNKGPSSSHIEVRGQKAYYSYRVPLSALPEGSWKKIEGGIQFDKRALLAFLSDDVRRFANRNQSNRGEYFVPKDIDAITGVTKIGRPGLPGRRVRLDQPTGEGGEALEGVLNVPHPSAEEIRRPITGIARRALDGLRDRNVDLFRQLIDSRYDELGDTFWNSVKAEFMQMEEFKSLPEAIDVLHASDAMVKLFQQMKESGRLNAQASFRIGRTVSRQPVGHRRIVGEPTEDQVADLRDARKLLDDPDNGLSEETKSLLRDMLDSPIAGYLNGRDIKFRIADAVGHGFGATWSPAEQMISLSRYSTDAKSGPEEFFHALWEMIQDPDRQNVERWRQDAIAATMKTATGKDLELLQRLAAGEEVSSRDFVAFEYNPKLYPLRSAEEYFAETFTDRWARDRQGIWGQAKEILASQDSFMSKIRQILDVIFDSLRRRIPGLTGEIERLQQTILSGKYDVLPPSENVPGVRLVTKNAVVTAPGAMGHPRELQGALQSEKAIEKFVEPLEETETPERFRRIASTVNTGLISQAAADRFFALPASVNLELKDLFTGRIGTQREGAQSFRDAMKDPNLSPEEKSDLSRYGLIEWQGYQFDRKKIINRQENAARKLDDFTRQAIEAIPPTNEAELRASISLGTVLDRIKAERDEAAQGAQSNERIREGIDHLDAITDLLGQPLAMSRALRGISDIVGRAELLNERRGEEVLNLISERAGYPTADSPTPHTPTQWVRGLAHHLDQMRDGDRRRVNASEDVIEATLWMLRQRADWRQELLEAQMTEDGTLRRFNADYIDDLRSRVPAGFSGVLSRYARHEAEARALRSAANRLNRKIIHLEERKNNLDQAVEFIRRHDADPDFIDFGKAVVETTGAISGIEQTENGYTITFKHPLNDSDVTLDFGFNKAGSKENIQRIIELDEAGMQYAARPDADPSKAAFWKDFNQRVRHELPAMDPDYARLADPLLDPLNILTGGVSRLLSHSRYGLIAGSTMARLPGPLPHKTNRALEAFGIALKTKNAFDKDHGQRVQNANEVAFRSHKKIPGDRVSTEAIWRDEVAGPIIDKRQHFGQNQYKVGDHIAGFGHVITPEDVKAVQAQYKYDQFLVRLAFKSGYISAVAEAPGRIKDKRLGVLRFPLSQGPGTVTRYLPPESRRLPDEWAAAVESFKVDEFLESSDNFVRTVLGHVLEDERNYKHLGKGPYAAEYKDIRADREDLERSGKMPNNMNDLAGMIADRHNRNLAEGEEPSTMSDVRQQLIDEVTVYMKEIAKDEAERKQLESQIDIVSHENEYSQPRSAKIAPGTLYRYGVMDKIDMIRKGNNAVEFYVVRYRDLLRKTQDALLDEKRKVVDTLRSEYGGEGWQARQQFRKGIIAGDDPRLQRHQMTVREIDSNIDRIGKLLQNANDIIRRREEFYGDDIADRLFSPWMNSAVGSVLLSPRAWLTNLGSGDVMWALKAAEIRRGGWMGMPAHWIKDHLTGYMKAIVKARTPKNAKERAYQKLIEDNPALIDGVAEHLTGILQHIQDREALRRTGVTDSHSYKDAFGWDTDRPMAENLKGIVDALIEVKAEPSLSARKDIFNAFGAIPRGFNMAIARKIGMRNVDNWINARSVVFASAMAETLRTQAIKSFDGRMEHDPVFRQAFEQYGDNFDRFYLQLMRNAQKGVLLTPAELTGRWTPASALTISKAAVQLRRQFSKNNDPIDWLMLKYWWNKRAANGDRNAPFMDPQQRLALHFSLAEDVNMATPASRPTFFMGSRNRQMLGVLSQWWLWNVDRLQDIFSKVKGQKAGGARYLPGAIAFLLATAASGLVYTSTGQKLNELAFNAVGNQPNIWDAESDEDKLRIITSLAANYWAMVGSFYKAATDTPGKLGYRNPVFYLNMANDFISAGAKIWSSGDFEGPLLDLTARYVPPLRAVINRLPSRQGLMEVRDAANLLRAATPESLEAKRRAPVSGSDIRATPMTPLYNAILNAAALGDWSAADESFAKAVDLARASGVVNPEQSIVSAIRSRSPETAVYTRALTAEERDLVYSRLNPANLEKVERANRVFEDIASRYGSGGGRAAGGARAAGIAPRAALGGFLAGGRVGIAGGSRLSLAPRGVRTGFRTRSLQRGLRTRSLLRGIRRPSVGGRLRRLAI